MRSSSSLILMYTDRIKRRETPCALAALESGRTRSVCWLRAGRTGSFAMCAASAAGTRLFAGLIGGRLTEESIQSSVNAVDELAQCARGDGAQEIFVFATSAVRDAANGRAFTDRCEAACGARVEIVSGEEEAVLSYIGASDGGVCGMIDIGGGSTEFTLGEGEKICGAVSLQMGAVRMNAQRPVLRLDDYAATVEQCRRLIQRDAPGAADAGDEAGLGRCRRDDDHAGRDAARHSAF